MLREQVGRLEQCMLFDAAWYRRHYLANQPSASPALHYIEHGAASGHLPSLMFDTRRYRLDNPDIGERNPLLHFMEVDGIEHRWMHPVVAQGIEREAELFNGGEGLPRSTLRVACVIHAFYADVFEELCPNLRHLPPGSSLLIAVVSEADRDRVLASVRAAPLDFPLTCRVLKNQGRNFGSFLAFAPEILAHDVVLHLHTKRSLYTGTEQRQWRDHLYQGLIGTPALPTLVAQNFARHPKLGLVYPTTFAGLPYWAHHWLANGGTGPALLQRLGVSSLPGRYFAYPVGGMFWARVDAIRPLLEAGITQDEFPEEAGQTDGTLAHAIERVVGILSAARGYRAVQFDPEAGFVIDQPDLLLWQYSGARREELTQRMAAAHLVSFDLFDTLLVRPTLSPDASLQLLGRMLERRDARLTGFFTLRRNAENEARRRKNWQGDVDLIEIYEQIAAMRQLDDGETQRLMHEELALEERMLRPREDMLDVLREARAAGCRTAIISDTYFTRDFIDRLLRRLGIDGLIDVTYLSSERQARKDRGDLWALVGTAEAVAPADWLHIGDNEHSDIQATCDRGIGWYHVMHPGPLLEYTGFDVQDHEGWPAHLLVGHAMLKLANSPFGPVTQRVAPVRNLEDFGYVVFGPLVLAFLGWLAAHPALRLQHHVYFLSREGYVLRDLYEAMRESFPELGLPPSTYFHISRRVVLATAQASRFDAAMILEGTGFHGSFADLLKNRIGFEPDLPSPLGDWTIRLPEDAESVKKAIDALQPELQEHAMHEAELLTAYCRQCGMEAGGRYAVVDIGYSGTIQRGLQMSFDATFTGFYFATFSSIQRAEDAGGHTFGYYEDFIRPWSSERPLAKHSFFVESFLTAPHTQVQGYRSVDGSIEPVFKTPVAGTESSVAVLERLHDGARNFCRDSLECFGSELLRLPLGRLSAQEFLRLYFGRRILPPPELLAAIQVEDDFTGRGIVNFTAAV